MSYPANRRKFGHIYKRGPVWYARFTVRGKRRDESTRSRRRADAVKLLAQRQAEIERGTYALVCPAPPRTPLAAICKARRLTKKELARRAGCTGSYISKLDQVYPRLWWRLARLADALNVATDEILGRALPTRSVDVLSAQDRELLDAFRADAIATFGPRIGEQWRRIARYQFAGFLARHLNQDLPRSDNNAPLIEEWSAKQRVAIAKRLATGQQTRLEPQPSVAVLIRPVEVLEPLKPVNGRLYPADYFTGWESPRERAHRLNRPYAQELKRERQASLKRERRARLHTYRQRRLAAKGVAP